MNNKRSLITILLMLCLEFVIAQATEFVYLSGTGFDNTIEWDFYCTAGMKSGQWMKIEVPSCWEQQGFGEYNYGTVPFNDRLKEEGHYRHSFTAPEEWKGKNIRLVFEGVMTDCRVSLNGRPAGNPHQGAFYRFSYDISGLLAYGKVNMLEVKVKKFSDNISVNMAERKADYWTFGGIFRPVYLEIKPDKHIRGIAVDARADGSFRSNIKLDRGEKASVLKVSILDAEGKEKALVSTQLEKTAKTASIYGKLDQPLLWSPEFPHLYTALFLLLDKEGNVLHETKEKIGFRTVELREGDGIYLNGTRIKFKGVNRHSFHPDHGRTSCKSLSIEAVNLIKDMNMNAVRMSHYPPDPHFLDACDSMGLMVLDELAGWQHPPYDSVVGRKLLQEMIARDVNHPCIVIWDNGNEGGWNTIYDDDFVALDIQEREVLHPWAVFRKTNTAHYPDYDYISTDHFASGKIFFPTEFLHGLYDGGHGAGLEDYWMRMWNDPLCAGGFLWVFADESVKRTDTGELDSDGNHAPDGILGPYHEKEGSFYSIRETWSPVHFEKRKITSSFDGSFKVENRYHFTAFDQCSFSFRWVKLPHPPGDRIRDAGKDYPGDILLEGTPVADALLPGQRGTLTVELPEKLSTADVLYIEAHDPHGRLIHRWSWPARSPGDLVPELLNSGRKKDAGITRVRADSSYAESRTTGLTGSRITEKPGRMILEASGIRIEISTVSGMLEKISNTDGELALSGGMIIGTGQAPVSEIEHFKQDRSWHIRILREDMSRIEWILHPGGILDMEARYRINESETPYAGISFNYPEVMAQTVTYLGDGPYRAWKNRLSGTNYGVWRKDYNNTITGYRGFEYPEFKGYYSNLFWADFRDSQGKGFTVYCHSDDIFLRLYSPEEAPEPLNTSVDHPEGDISFMHGIPAIGTKFKEAAELGPQSCNYKYLDRRIPGGALDISLSFDFR